MTADELKELERGDIVRHLGDAGSFVVCDNFGKRVTAVRTADITNPSEWEVVVRKKDPDGLGVCAICRMPLRVVNRSVCTSCIPK